jgi:hypothetical protein
MGALEGRDPCPPDPQDSPTQKSEEPEMIDRNLLEQPHALNAMRDILDKFGTDREGFPDDMVQRRRGLAKDIVEEYAPLYRLGCVLQAFETGRLTPAGIAGPDAIVQLTNGTSVAVQITTAGESESTALHRELLSKKHVVFPNQIASRLPVQKQIQTQGRVLTTRRGNTEVMIAEVIAAIQKKVAKFHEGTKLLLVHIRQPSASLEDTWPASLQAALEGVSISPYEAVYVANTQTCVMGAGN